MNDNQLDTQFHNLLEAIGVMPVEEVSIQKDRASMTHFMGYLSQNEVEITKFGKASEEACDYLDKYNFTKGYHFDPMQKKLEALHPLRLKLAKMGEEAKKLAVFPDR